MARAFDRLSGVKSTPRARGKREERTDVVVEDEKQELEEQQNHDVYGDAVNQAAGITQVESSAMKPKIAAPWAKKDGQGNQGNQQTQFAGTVAGQTTGNAEGTVAGNTSANTDGTLAEINQPHIPANGTEPKVEGKKLSSPFKKPSGEEEGTEVSGSTKYVFKGKSYDKPEYMYPEVFEEARRLGISTTIEDGGVKRPKNALELYNEINAYQSSQEENEPQKGMYEQLWEEQNRRLQMSEEELAKQKRRERAQKAIAAFGDLATAAVNTGFATKGANTPTETPNLSERYSGMWKDWYNEYKANQDKYVTGRENARKLDYQERKADREYQLKLQREQRMQEKQNVDNQLSTLKAQKMQIEIDAKMDPEAKKAALDKLNAEINRLNLQSEKIKNDMKNDDLKTQYQLGKPYYNPNSSGQGGYTFNGKTYKSEAAAYPDIVEEAIRLGIETNALGKAKTAKALVADIAKKKAEQKNK